MWAHCKGEYAGVRGPTKIWEEETLAGMESFRPVTQKVLSGPPGHSGRGRGLRLRLEGVAYQQRRGWGGAF